MCVHVCLSYNRKISLHPCRNALRSFAQGANRSFGPLISRFFFSSDRRATLRVKKTSPHPEDTYTHKFVESRGRARKHRLDSGSASSAHDMPCLTEASPLGGPTVRSLRSTRSRVCGDSSLVDEVAAGCAQAQAVNINSSSRFHYGVSCWH